MGSRNWCWTHQGTALDTSQWPDWVRYAVYQHEKAPTTGQDHLQGYMELSRAQRLTAMQKIPGMEGVHWEPRRGTRDGARRYCMKPETRAEGAEPVEIGEWDGGGQGKRTDLHDAVETLRSTGSLKRVAEEHATSYVKYYRGLAEWQKKVQPTITVAKYTLADFDHPPLDLSKTVVLYGPTGIGKTEFALAHFKSPLLVRHLDRLSDLDPTTHDGIVFDDMSFTHFPVESRIHLCDMDRPSDIHIRYVIAHIPAGMKRIFTHNTGDVFTKADQDMPESQTAAISRRVNYVRVDKLQK